jgi:pimeloyl-ACP methyl ester carboxylesterase
VFQLEQGFANLIDNSLYEIPAAAISQYYCFPKNEDCFTKTIQLFKSYKLESHNYDISIESQTNTTLSASKIFLSSQKKQPISILAIPGLYSNSNQFNKLIKVIANKLPINLISVSLPGHGDTGSRASYVSYTDWLLFTKKTLSIAHAIGERVIVMGQSLGGLLAFWLSVIDPKNVDALYLLDPAFGVSTKSYLLTCLSPYTMPFVDKAQDYGFIGELFSGQSFDDLKQPISAHMGCEVSKLSKYVASLAVEGDSDLARFGHLVKKSSAISTFIGYSEQDSFVDVDYIKLFMQNYLGFIQSSVLEQLNSDQRSDHSVIQSILENETFALVKPGAESTGVDSTENGKLLLEQKSLIELILKIWPQFKPLNSP